MVERHKIPMNKWALVILSSLLLSGILIDKVLRPPPTIESEPTTVERELSSFQLDDPVSFEQQVRPVLERRCVVCHGCYDAPCQLKLSSIEGLQRGASEKLVYNPARVTPMQPTRLFIDARGTSEWRTRGFQPVLNEGQQTPENNLKNSVLYRLLQLKKQHPQPRSDKLPESFTLELNREQSCPTLESMDEFIQEHPLWGMPYAMPELSQQEYRTLVTWLAQDAPSPAPPGPTATVLPQIRQWERFLNQSSNKQQLVSRYLYEHLFHAHIHFAGSPPREFYQLVRSTTPPGEAVDEIPTVRPYDDPGAASFYYRLLRYQPGIVVKSHVVYEFSDLRMERYRELFLEPDYDVHELPSYQAEIASNPFKAFIDIPLKSRYRFLLDDARFFIEGFIKGPVCRDQIALNVIEDRFWVLFFDPEQEVFTNDAQFIGEMSNELQLPADRRSSLNLFSIWSDYWQRQRRYMASKQALFERVNTHDINHAMGYIWDGDGANPNAALTVFRHFDSGSVTYGLVGDDPETTWIIDYPLFERIHYLLVAGFNVYGNLVHQLNTRIYMDFLRMEGEDHFLVFLPAERRKAIRDAWYAGLRAGVRKYFTAPQEWLQIESVKGYRSDDPQREFYQYIRDRLAGVAQQSDAMNRCGGHDCRKQAHDADMVQVNRAMGKIAQMQGANLHALPDVAFVRVRVDNPDQDIVYTLIRNKAYKNVTSFLADELERDRSDIDRDTMTVAPWLEGSYPNFFFSVALSEIDAFSERCAAIRNHEDYEKFVDLYGVRRTNPVFWEMADWFLDQAAKENPMRSGIFDLSRYQNL
jgi:hypothetical protein